MVATPIGETAVCSTSSGGQGSALQFTSDARGAVYVEFLFAFMPMLILCLAICQFAFIASAKMVVEHAAWSAARSAIVVIEDKPADYGGIPRGDVQQATSDDIPDVNDNLSALHAIRGRVGTVARTIDSAFRGAILYRSHDGHSHPSRMTKIRAAAYLPLLPLADTNSSPASATVRSAIHDTFSDRMAEALLVTQASSAITLHKSEDANAEPTATFEKNDAVTVRVTYLFSCGVPIVRWLMCRSRKWIMNNGRERERAALGQAEGVSNSDEVFPKFGRYTVLTGQATLVNQGAGYEKELK